MAITTNKEYLTAKLSKFGLSESDIDLIIIENTSLSGSLDVNACKLAIYKSMTSILPTADVTESDYSIRWNLEVLKLWYNSLCTELGKDNVLSPKVRNRSNYW